MKPADLQTRMLRVSGMICVNCQNLIERKLKSTAGIQDTSVSYETGTVTVTYNDSIIALSEIAAVIESLGYKVAAGKGKEQIPPIIGKLIIILALYMLLQTFSTSSLAMAFPIARSGMGYGMVLIIGLITSVHCIAMCGGINLSQTLRGNKTSRPDDALSAVRAAHSSLLTFFPAILYNAGRLISYTAVGVAVGTLGSVITVSGRFQGAALLLAGIFMLIMGINMLGLFPVFRRFVPRMPAQLQKGLTSIFAHGTDEPKTGMFGFKSGRGPLVVGFLNGFIPCGPLQAMQLYALSTGSPIRGGISMFLFCLGTIPLMFTLGAASGILSGAKGRVFSNRVMQAGAILIAAMGLAMFTNGWNVAGLDSPLDRITAFIRPDSLNNGDGGFTPVVQKGVQIINSTLLPSRYPAIVVQQGIPVHWTINAPPGSINGCNNRFIIREYGIEHTFKSGDNVIEFLPAKTGKFPYSCWMGMIRGSITVLAKGESITGVPEPDIAPKPAGVDIPVDAIAIARLTGNFQTVEIRLTDDGFEPAIVVMQRQLPALWNISIDSPCPGNSALIFPAYYTALDTEQGDNPLRIMPEADFDFSTGDNIFYGYVKVVDDINNVDIEAVKAQVAGYETMIYPEAYFAAASGGGCPCCRR